MGDDGIKTVTKKLRVVLTGDRNRLREAGLLAVIESFAHTAVSGVTAGVVESSMVAEICEVIRECTHVVAVDLTVPGSDVSPIVSVDAIPDGGGYDDGEVDLAICFGGDGSVLRAAKRLRGTPIPVLAVNLGHLGFLADVAPEELASTLRELCRTGIADRLHEHRMLRCRVVRENGTAGDGLGTIVESMVLNEVSVRAGATLRMIDLSLAIDGETVAHYSGDGLILATPVGSTAHSLAAGGPILRNTLDSVLICPLNPHTLTMRPVVDSAEREYVISVVKDAGMNVFVDGGLLDARTSVVVDGEVVARIGEGDRVEVTRAPYRFRTVTPPGHSYYRTLRAKLGWSGRFDTKKE